MSWVLIEALGGATPLTTPIKAGTFLDAVDAAKERYSGSEARALFPISLSSSSPRTPPHHGRISRRHQRRQWGHPKAFDRGQDPPSCRRRFRALRVEDADDRHNGQRHREDELMGTVRGVRPIFDRCNDTVVALDDVPTDADLCEGRGRGASKTVAARTFGVRRC